MPLGRRFSFGSATEMRWTPPAGVTTATPPFPCQSEQKSIPERCDSTDSGRMRARPMGLSSERSTGRIDIVPPINAYIKRLDFDHKDDVIVRYSGEFS